MFRGLVPFPVSVGRLGCFTSPVEERGCLLLTCELHLALLTVVGYVRQQGVCVGVAVTPPPGNAELAGPYEARVSDAHCPRPQPPPGPRGVILSSTLFRDLGSPSASLTVCPLGHLRLYRLRRLLKMRGSAPTAQAQT